MIRRFGERLLGHDTGIQVTSRWWHIVVVFVVGTVAVAFRLPVERWNILWAEDGGIFVPAAYRFEPQVLIETYAGYLHIVPRVLTAAAVAVVPVEYVPTAMTLLGSLVVGAVCVIIFVFARLRIRSTVICALLALQVALLPIAGHEVSGNVAYLQWYLMFAAVWAVVVIPRSRGLVVLQSVTVALAILSEPLVALLVAPFILVRVLSIRPWRSTAHIVTITFLASSVIQGIAVVISVLLEQRRTLSRVWPSPFAFAEDYGSRVGLDSLFGVTGTTNITETLGRPAIITGLAVIVIVVALLAKLDRERRLLIVAFGAASACMSFVTEALSWELLSQFSPNDLLAGSRYHVTPVFLLFSAYAIGADHLASRLRERQLGWIPVAVLAAIVVVPGVVDYRLVDQRANTPDWISQVAAARMDCAADPTLDLVGLKISPSWMMDAKIPCAVLVAR